jgi:adenylate cyclase
MSGSHSEHETQADRQIAAGGENRYRIDIEPIRGRVRVRIGGAVVADSNNAMLLRETHFPTHCYFPKADLKDDLLIPSAFRTFCPFKGTAHFWDLQLPNRTITNGAWSYERPLAEAVPVGGHVAFDERAVEAFEADPPLPPTVVEPIGGCPLIEWLLLKAWRCTTPAQLTEQFAGKLVECGIPLWRFTVNLWTLHPEIAGQRFTWVRGVDGVAESDTPHGILQNPAYRNSPVRFVSERRGGVRQRLDIDNPEFPFPMLEQLRAQGGTDYVAIPLPFSDGRFQAMSMATDHPEGFTTAQLGRAFEAFGILGRYFEVLTLRREAGVLFETYLGERTGRQVLSGQTRRGAGQIIRAAVLYCDLRNSTALTEALPRESYLALLNDFFERAVDPILAQGGEVLKFIGDAVLAIFPMEGDEASEEAIVGACRRAREAAENILAQVAAAPARSDGFSMQCAVGLHVGDVMYGNVGAPQRLDFTVIGQAANVAARLSGLCKELDRSMLFSADAAHRAPEGLGSLGSHKLRNVGSDVEVFALAGMDFV